MTVHELTDHGRAYRIVDPGGRIGSKIARGEPYERRLLTDIRQRHHSGTAVDVGAHVGNHSLYLAAVCGLRVLAFEADPDTFARLEANLNLNPQLDIEAHNVALSDAAGTGNVAPEMTVTPGPGPVTLARFDSLAHVDDLTVVKVDVEGMEPAVLAGMAEHLERCGPAVYAETHTAEAEQAIRDVLGPLGYEVTRRIAMGSMMHRWERR